MIVLEQNVTWEFGHTSTREESRWVQVCLHCQVKPIWVFNSLKGKISCIFTGVWTELCGYLLHSQEDDVCASLYVISKQHTTGHFINWTSRMPLMRRFTWSNHQTLLFKGNARRFTDWKSHSTVWKSLRAWVGHFALVIQEFNSIAHRKTTMCFDGYGMRRRSCWLCMWMILWSQEMTQRELTLWRSICRSTFRPKDLESPKYLGIVVVRSQKGILLSQRKYIVNLLSESGMLGCWSIDSPMDVNMKLLPN